MCDQCGCGIPSHGGAHGHGHAHDHSHETVSIETDVLEHNRAHAEELRKRMAEMGARLVNIIGSPGCGKTELLAKLIPMMTIPCAVVEGDLATDNDAKRIRQTGAPVHQIQTGTACHLNAHDVAHALAHLPIEKGTLLMVENVGNLVCPSMFDIGENLRIVCLSVTEGTDKPQKYPVSFREADIAVITKSDLLPYVDFDLSLCRRLINDIHPDMPMFVTTAKRDEEVASLRDRLLQLWEV
jgi:hydrogenase nickel incorporation protein HypB